MIKENKKFGQSKSTNSTTSTCLADGNGPSSDPVQKSGDRPVQMSDVLKKYTAEELLTKKPFRGVTSKAQQLCVRLIRDAAQEAGIWNSRLAIRDIAQSQKETFFSCIEQVAPQLVVNRSRLWSRLARNLQNRRRHQALQEEGRKIESKLRKILPSSARF